MKRNKTLRVFMTLSLALVMCLGSITNAFAAQGPITGGTETDPAQAVITKALQMPIGTTTPAATFSFTFAKKSVDDDNSTTAQSTMPTISNKSVTFAGTATGTDSGGIKTVKGETTSLFAGITWPHAGVYTYTVTEQTGTYSGGTDEIVTYSLAEYDISVYVANGASGLYVAAIGTTIVKTDDGTSSGTGKTDPGESTTISGAFSAMTFTNSYVKNNGGENPTDPTDQTLAISKTVAGDYGDHTKYFAYSVTVTQSALSSGTTYKGYVVEKVAGMSAVVTSSANGTIANTDTHGPYINFSSGSAVTVNLKHGQTLAFVDNEVGSSYVALESGVADYTPSIALVVNGASSTISGTLNTSLSTGTQLIGDSTNSAAFTNTYKSVTPTGISLESLPFITMIVLAAGALVAFVVVKSRKRLHASKN